MTPHTPLIEALKRAIAVADEAYDEWDRLPSDMKRGKILSALSGHLPNYRTDIDEIHEALRIATETTEPDADKGNGDVIERAAKAMFDDNEAFIDTSGRSPWTWEIIADDQKGYWRSLARAALASAGLLKLSEGSCDGKMRETVIATLEAAFDYRRNHLPESVRRAMETAIASVKALPASPDPDKMSIALAKINVIRNSIIGFQTVNFSEHVYPLVAALEEAGFEGEGYAASRENVGTLLERAVRAEDELAALKAAPSPITDESLPTDVKLEPGWLARDVARASRRADELSGKSPSPTDAEGMREKAAALVDCAVRACKAAKYKGASIDGLETLAREIRALPTPAREIDRQDLMKLLLSFGNHEHRTVGSLGHQFTQDLADAILSLIGGRHV